MKRTAVFLVSALFLISLGYMPLLLSSDHIEPYATVSEAAFAVQNSNESEQLIMNHINYSTFIGGNEHEETGSIAVDRFGCVYITGITESPDFPLVNAYDNTMGGNQDCFVSKFSADGSELLYSTFIGGQSSEHGSSIAVDSSGCAFVTGVTESSDFPTVNAYDRTYEGGLECFVFKLSADGSELLYSTLVGGAESDYASSIAIDSWGNAFVTGRTESSDFPTVNTFGSTNTGGSGGCFVFKLSADGSELLYSTLIGGTESEDASSIAVDSSGNAFVTGRTTSPDFPIVNAFGDIIQGGSECFVFKLSADGSELLYSTFIGGVESDYASSIAIDSSGNAFVTGNTESSDFPTVNAFNETIGGWTDCFVFKLSADGSELLYSTFIGGVEFDYAKSIAIDSSGIAFVTGITESSDFPMVNAFDSTIEGGCCSTDCFVFKLSANGSNLVYSTFIGGQYSDCATSIAIDETGGVFIGGSTESADFPIINGYDSTYERIGDCFVLKLTLRADVEAISTDEPIVPIEWLVISAGTVGVAMVAVIVILLKRE
ncbi:MAG: SBBP repeat-containing protein [Candidatus Hermodarchaeota archaeon]